ncbi:class I SAM-dependent methyltransferase [bacterium]|nr:class I SAM-dependent methyltransferase [bacterium]
MINEEKIKIWYNRRHSSLGQKSWRPFKAYHNFLDYLNIKSGGKLLDIGSGTGFLLKLANRNGLRTYGVDISIEGVKIAKNTSPDSIIIVNSGENLAFLDNTFDYITCIGVLEHFIDIENGIAEILRVAKDNAIFCIVVPNINYFFWKIKGKKGTIQQDINEHLFSLEQWENLFAKNGLKISEIHQDKWFMIKDKIFSSLNPIKITKKIIYKLIWLFMPLKNTYQFIFILRKNDN